MADEPIAPPLPSGSVDFDKIHAAARQNHDLEKAIADATFVHPAAAALEQEADSSNAPTPPASVFTSSHVGGGVYEIAGPGLHEPERVKGKAEADDRVTELTEAHKAAAAAGNQEA